MEDNATPINPYQLLLPGEMAGMRDFTPRATKADEPEAPPKASSAAASATSSESGTQLEIQFDETEEPLAPVVKDSPAPKSQVGHSIPASLPKTSSGKTEPPAGD